MERKRKMEAESLGGRRGKRKETKGETWQSCSEARAKG
jgi:hypothetical protein